VKIKFEFVGILCRGQHVTRVLTADVLPRVGEHLSIDAEGVSNIALYFKVDAVFHRVYRETPHTVNKIVVMGRLTEL